MTRRKRIDQHAPNGKFRVIGVDTFEGAHADYLVGDYPLLDAARHVAIERGGNMNPVYVYDQNAKLLFQAGSS